ncbi:AI-2E family transporter [Bacillus sp. SD088]|uniref:AI-2E family transporter n=1 Tax=Bacillus sp. SD088 TaxID=2782012 RepID=UPI001A959690|nr:AI-2E family transporter [Bacillus sp. SD088]MBO0993862.1 AI-2E family transporter [Bacillus sp. SD088]
MKQPTRFIRFLGGRDLIFALVILIFIGITIFIYNKISFIFHPVIVILSTIAAPIILAFIAYYIMNPIVNLLERLHIKRIWGIIIIILGIGGLITGLVFLLAPSIEKQINDLIVDIPIYLKQMGEEINDWVDHSFFGPYYDEGYKWVTSTLSDLPNKISGYLGGAYEGILSIASTLTHVFVALFTFPFVLFFLLKDSAKFKSYYLQLLPPKYRGDADQVLKNIDVQVGSYIRGQIIVATCIGILLYIGYLIIGLDYAITLAIVAAVTSVVPYLGPMIAVSPAIIIALVDSPFMLVKLAIVWAAVQFLEGHFISPNIMGHTMKIHPITIMFILLVGGNLFGVVGVILGIPGYAILKVIVVHFFGKFKQRYNKYYGEDAGAYQMDEQAHK